MYFHYSYFTFNSWKTKMLSWITFILHYTDRVSVPWISFIFEKKTHKYNDKLISPLLHRMRILFTFSMPSISIKVKNDWNDYCSTSIWLIVKLSLVFYWTTTKKWIRSEHEFNRSYICSLNDCDFIIPNLHDLCQNNSVDYIYRYFVK